MIAIDNTLISDEIVEEHFVCDLNKCKGGCCVDGDAGAPLTDEEAELLKEIYPKVKHLLTPRAIQEIESSGAYTHDDTFGWVTPTLDEGICVYGYYDEGNIVKCAIEQEYYKGNLTFKKPISCHLYPIRIESYKNYDALNYEPRPQMCKPACKLGKSLRVPVYQFLKEPLIRKYGEEFYNALDATAQELKSNQ